MPNAVLTSTSSCYSRAPNISNIGLPNTVVLGVYVLGQDAMGSICLHMPECIYVCTLADRLVELRAAVCCSPSMPLLT
jgi:hypothetical protein